MNGNVPGFSRPSPTTQMDQVPRATMSTDMARERLSDLLNVSPLAAGLKLLVDPIVVVAIYILLGRIMNVQFSEQARIFSVLALLLSATLLDGALLFLPGRATTLFGIIRFFIGWAGLLIALYSIVLFAGLDAYLYPPQIIAWAICAPLAMLGFHATLKSVVTLIRAHEASVERIVLIGATSTAQIISKSFKSQPWLRTQVVGLFDDRSRERLNLAECEPLIDTIDGLASFVKENEIDRIFITLPMTSQPRLLELLDDLKDSTVSIYFVPDMFMFDLIQARFCKLNGIPVVAIRETPFVGVRGLCKRVMDIVLSVLFIVLLAPLMLVIAALVKWTSPGPILFKQRRYGVDGKSIVVYKFRSMIVHEDEAYVIQAKKSDVRLTRIGAFLRKTSIDELPQFLNVLQGRMSIVGPRPHAVSHNEEYRRLISGYMIRHKVRPGITGLAQVNGCRGETETLEKMQRRIDFDLEYLRNWSVWLDVKIIIKTAYVVLRGNDAY